MRRILATSLADGGWVAVAAVLLWLTLSWPLLSGERTLVLRDVLTTHLPFKSFGAEELAHGRIPAMNPNWSGGQPFRGNPNALAFYPGNLLYLLLPFWSAFNAHYMVHWLLAFVGMFHLGRRLGQSRAAAIVAGLAYGGSGFLFSCLTFMNLLTVAAWAPWVLAGLVRGGRRGTVEAGICFGLVLLGGEPVSTMLLVPLLVAVAWRRHGVRGGAAVLLGTAALGALVAAPQIVATARVVGFSFRASHGLSPSEVVAHNLPLPRLLELVWPMPWGWPSGLDRFGFWSKRVTETVPYIYSFHFGLIAFVLALGALRRQRLWAILAGGSWLAGWLLGLDSAITTQLTLGMFRYPQKVALPFTLAAAVLAGFGLDTIRRRESPARPWLIAAGVAAGSAVALGWGRAPFAEWLRLHFASGESEIVAQTQTSHWWILAILATMLLGAGALAARRRSVAGLAALQLVALLQMSPAWLTDETAPYRRPATLAAAITAPRTVAQVPMTMPSWEAPQKYEPAANQPLNLLHVIRASLGTDTGVLDRLEHVVPPDLDGLTSPLTVFLLATLATADWPTRIDWLERLGTGWIVRASTAPGPDLEVVRSESHFGGTTELLRVPHPAPRVGWPEAIVVAANPIAARQLVASRRIDRSTAVASRAVEHHPGGRVELVSELPDRIVFDVDSAGGLAVVRRTWWPLFRARLDDGSTLATQPVDVAMLGVEVPAGHHTVTVAISAWPEEIAGGVALFALLAAWYVARTRP